MFYNRYNIIPDERDYAEVDLLEEGMPSAERFLQAQNLQLHRLAEAVGFSDIPGETGKAN
jgi:hypothetical protein